MTGFISKCLGNVGINVHTFVKLGTPQGWSLGATAQTCQSKYLLKKWELSPCVPSTSPGLVTALADGGQVTSVAAESESAHSNLRSAALAAGHDSLSSMSPLGVGMLGQGREDGSPTTGPGTELVAKTHGGGRFRPCTLHDKHSKN